MTHLDTYSSNKVKLGYAIKHFLSFRVTHCFIIFGTKNNKVFCDIKKLIVRKELYLHVLVFQLFVDLWAHLSRCPPFLVPLFLLVLRPSLLFPNPAQCPFPCNQTLVRVHPFAQHPSLFSAHLCSPPIYQVSIFGPEYKCKIKNDRERQTKEGQAGGTRHCLYCLFTEGDQFGGWGSGGGGRYLRQVNRQAGAQSSVIGQAAKHCKHAAG